MTALTALQSAEADRSRLTELVVFRVPPGRREALAMAAWRKRMSLAEFMRQVTDRAVPPEAPRVNERVA